MTIFYKERNYFANKKMIKMAALIKFTVISENTKTI